MVAASNAVSQEHQFFMCYLAILDHAEVEPAANSAGENFKVAFMPWEKKERD